MNRSARKNQVSVFPSSWRKNGGLLIGIWRPRVAPVGWMDLRVLGDGDALRCFARVFGARFDAESFVSFCTMEVMLESSPGWSSGRETGSLMSERSFSILRFRTVEL